MLIPIESWEITRMRVASFTRLSETLGTRLDSLLVFFYLCLVSVLFSGPSITEMKFSETFFPSFCSFSGVF